MELRYVQCPTVSTIPRNGMFTHNNSFLNLPINKKSKCQHFRRIRFLDLRAPPSGITKIKCQAQAATTSVGAKDGNLVFVAGATGRVGSRTVRELIKLGCSVRAGVRSIKRAESLAQSVKNIRVEDVAGGTQPIDKLELVECDLEKPDQIAPALGNSSVVICCIGASEKEIFDVTGPYRIDYQATKNLVDAATSVKVEHFILVTSLGTNKVGFPAAILNLFWGVLCWKRKAEEALLASGLPYTIVRPGGMERPTDSYKETHNITLSEEDTLFGGQVSTLQVAELMAFMAKNRSLSYCKVVEVVAETTAPLTPMGDLLKKIPSQRKEPVPKELDNASVSQPIPERTSAEREPEQKKPTVATSSSPYTAYEDLKPPTSPTPTPSTTPGDTKTSKTEIPPAATSPISSAEVSSSETSSTVTEMKKPTPLSPYINYEDLKPPTSPTPTPSKTPGATTNASKTEITPAATSPVSSPTDINSPETSSMVAELKSIITELKKPTPLSPYTMYEDLKPPCSPSPTPSGPEKESAAIQPSAEVASPLSGGNGDAKSGFVSPNIAYDDLKPPSSTPSVPAVTEAISSYQTESKAQPLSPYTMYEDLKPPSSPIPSPRKL